MEITRDEIIVVKNISKDNFGNLRWEDGNNNKYSISSKRIAYFENVIKEGIAVKLNFTKNTYGKEYIWSAELVSDLLPEPQKNTTAELPPETRKEIEKAYKEATGKMTKQDWNERDQITRKSIERQVSLKEAVNWCLGKELTTQDVIEAAIRFESYLETGK